MELDALNSSYPPPSPLPTPTPVTSAPPSFAADLGDSGAGSAAGAFAAPVAPPTSGLGLFADVAEAGEKFFDGIRAAQGNLPPDLAPGAVFQFGESAKLLERGSFVVENTGRAFAAFEALTSQDPTRDGAALFGKEVAEEVVEQLGQSRVLGQITAGARLAEFGKVTTAGILAGAAIENTIGGAIDAARRGYDQDAGFNDLFVANARHEAARFRAELRDASLIGKVAVTFKHTYHAIGADLTALAVGAKRLLFGR